MSYRAKCTVRLVISFLFLTENELGQTCTSPRESNTVIVTTIYNPIWLHLKAQALTYFSLSFSFVRRFISLLDCQASEVLMKYGPNHISRHKLKEAFANASANFYCPSSTNVLSFMSLVALFQDSTWYATMAHGGNVA